MPRDNSTAARTRRREAAEDRQAAYDKLTIDQKITRAAKRPGNSHKEITRLGIKAGIYPADIEEQRRAYEEKVLANPELVAALDKGIKSLEEGNGVVAKRRSRR